MLGLTLVPVAVAAGLTWWGRHDLFGRGHVPKRRGHGILRRMVRR